MLKQYCQFISIKCYTLLLTCKSKVLNWKKENKFIRDEGSTVGGYFQIGWICTECTYSRALYMFLFWNRFLAIGRNFSSLSFSQDLTFVQIGNPDLIEGKINFAKRWQQFNILVSSGLFFLSSSMSQTVILSSKGFPVSNCKIENQANSNLAYIHA